MVLLLVNKTKIMIKNIVLLAFIFSVYSSSAQIEKPLNKELSQQFKQYYNNSEYEIIFDLFSKEMQAALPLKTTTDFLKGVKMQAGNIRTLELTGYENGSYAVYKTTYENGIFSLNISVDDASKINGLLIKPYIEKPTTSTVKNHLFLTNDAITKEQTDLIYEKTKNFPDQTQLAIVLIKNGTPCSYGVKINKDTLSNINNVKSIFEIGSITKVFTATLLAESVVDKQLNLDEPIDKYLDAPLNQKATITFKKLSNHTSGLPAMPSNLDLEKVDQKNPYKLYDGDDMETYLSKEMVIANPTATQYEYSNLGTGLLGHLLSKQAGISFDSLLHQKIYSKYDMQHTTSELDQLSRDLVLVKGLDAEGNVTSNWEFSALAGAGSILSNVADLSKFAIAQFDLSNKALALTRTPTFEINQNMSVGLGWHLLQSKHGNQWYWHNGGTGGYSSTMTIDVKNKNGIIILSNVSAFHANMGNIDDLSFELMDGLEEQ